MPDKAFLPRLTFSALLACGFSLLSLSGCSTPGQQLANAEIITMNSARSENPRAPAPYLGSSGAGQPPNLSTNSASYDQFNPGLSDSVAVPFLSFLIIEPDPVTKNAIPSDVEKLIKAKQYEPAQDAMDAALKKNPGNVQLRFVKARLYLETRQWALAQKTLIEITQQFPELPEPYNNLAAIAANQGNWIEARDYLELALKLRPSYGIASANLGEVYIHLGAISYENAAQWAKLNQRQYANHAKALMAILQPPKKPVAPVSAQPTVKPAIEVETTPPNQFIKPPESDSNYGQSTPKN
jgi:tetratricopeptide (TPR) repeat protein